MTFLSWWVLFSYSGFCKRKNSSFFWVVAEMKEYIKFLKYEINYFEKYLRIMNYLKELICYKTPNIM